MFWLQENGLRHKDVTLVCRCLFHHDLGLALICPRRAGVSCVDTEIGHSSDTDGGLVHTRRLWSIGRGEGRTTLEVRPQRLEGGFGTSLRKEKRVMPLVDIT